MSKAFTAFDSAVSCLTAAALLLAQVPTARAASAMTRAEYEACQARDEQRLPRRHRGADAQGAWRPASPTSTTRRWSPTSGGAAISTTSSTAQVDQAIGEVRDESSWFQLWSSLASREKAQELATTAAERVYRSDADQEGHRGAGDAASARRSASASSSPPSTRPARRPSACRPSSAGATASTVARIVGDRRRQGIRHRSGQGRRPGLHRPGAGRGQRRHRRHGGAGGAPPARQHGRAHRPAHRRLDPEPARVGGGRRRRPGADRQGHLGFPPRRAADHRRAR